MIPFAAAAVARRLLDFSSAPMILRFIPGVMREGNLRRALLIQDGSRDVPWTRPPTLPIRLVPPSLAARLRRVGKTARTPAKGCGD